MSVLNLKSETGPADDVIRLRPAGRPSGHLGNRLVDMDVWLIFLFVFLYCFTNPIMSTAKKRSTKNCVAFGCNNVANEAAKEAGITFHR